MTTPTTLDELFPSKYLSASDAPQDTVVTIKAISQELLKNKDTQKDELKPVVFFNEFEKCMILNKTNKAILNDLYGNSIADLIGQRVILYAPICESFGKRAPALRFKEQKPPADKAQVMERYQKLWERGNKLGIDGIGDYVISASMTSEEIIVLGKELKAKVEAAEQF